MTSVHRKTNNTILAAHLWMEFPLITNPKTLRFRKYFLDIIPVVGARNWTTAGDCSKITVFSKARFPENELEMRFDITSLYKACREVDDSKYFNFKLRFYVPSKTSDIDLQKDYSDIFIIFKEIDNHEDFLGFSPIEVTHMAQKLQKRFKKPQLRKLRSRRKRSKPCSLIRWVLDFEDIGWGNWIYAPLKYEANLCHGRCSFPLANHLNSTNYAIVKSIVSSVFGKPKGANCVSQDLAPLTMIVKDEEKATVKIQKDMITKSCACL